MDIFGESFRIIGKLRGVQKFVLLRIFVVINVAAYFLATKDYFDNDLANVSSMFVLYGNSEQVPPSRLQLDVQTQGYHR
ncbi:MAG TPA: hypothetical protein VMV91_16920 [Rhodocyclaceae bacterium]|nr:hypothetical protein [Rhodocyclaceae bacterium]